MGKADDEEMMAMMLAMGMPVSFGGSSNSLKSKNQQQRQANAKAAEGEVGSAKFEASRRQVPLVEQPSTSSSTYSTSYSTSSSTSSALSLAVSLAVSSNKQQPAKGEGEGKEASELAFTSKVDEDEDDHDKEDFGPQVPPSSLSNKDDRDEEEGDNLVDYSDNLPITHEILLKDHSKAVSALCLDPAGARIITGGRDDTVKLWDFAGMDGASCKPFKSLVEPCGGNPIRDVQFSCSGDQFLIATGSAQAKLFDRDGNEISEFMKGDPYLRDLRNTKGHTSALTSCRWHPSDKRQVMTASFDSTVRIWDIEKPRTNKYVISIKSKLPGGRSPITAISYSPDGKLIVAAAQDGSITVWPATGPFIKPIREIEGAHMSGSGASGLTFSIINHTFVTRGMDDTVKLFDLRNTKKTNGSGSSVAAVTGIPNFFEETNIVFSPDERFVVTGTSVKRSMVDNFGKLMFFDAKTLEHCGSSSSSSSSTTTLNQSDIEVSRANSVVRVAWHSRINQIVCGVSNGDVHVMYDPHTSSRGAKMVLSKAPKIRRIEDTLVFGSLEAIDGERTSQHDQMTDMKRKRGKIRKDPILTKMPEMQKKQPYNGMASFAVEHIMKNIAPDLSRTQDPREALLAQHEKAMADPKWVNKAYQKTQPVHVFADSVYEDEEEAQLDKMKKRRQ